MAANIKNIIAQNKYLSGINGNWRSYWQDIADFCLPRKAWVDTIKTTGERIKYNFLYDSVAIRGLQTMASGFHSNLTNPSTKFFEIRLRNPKAMKKHAVWLWCHEVTEIIFNALNPSNFDTTAQEFYTDSGAFGTGCILTQEDLHEKVRYTSVPVEQINIEEDANGRVCAVYRNFKLQPIQAYMLWGNNAGKNVLEMIKEEHYFTEPGLDFLHYVGPRERRDFTKRDNLNMPYESVWINVKEEHLIKESGFKRFPYQVGRFWKHALDPFGFSPAMNVLADIKLINAGKRTWMRRAMKETDPAIGVPYKGWMAPINMNPTATNYYDLKVGPDSLRYLSPTGTFSIAQEFLAEIKEAIEQGFFVPLFRTLSDVNKNMTVPEVQRRIAENMGLLGPVIGRFIHEVWSPLIFSTFDILWEAGAIPPAPPEIEGEDMDIIYLSTLARAQRMSEMQPIGNFLQVVGQMAQIKPEILDKVDEDKTVDVIADLMSVTPEILRSEEVVKQIREARKAEQQQQLQLMKLEQASKIAKQGADANKSMQEAGAK
jgi:hypothetical protein